MSEFTKLGINQFMPSFRENGLHLGAGLNEVTSHQELYQLEIASGDIKLSLLQCISLFTAILCWKKLQ